MLAEGRGFVSELIGFLFAEKDHSVPTRNIPFQPALMVAVPGLCARSRA
jgi:hypothetical protein